MAYYEDRPTEQWEYIRNTGIAFHVLRELMDHDIFQNLTKHNPYFHSEEGNKEDKLWELYGILKYIQSEHEKMWEAFMK